MPTPHPTLPHSSPLPTHKLKRQALLRDRQQNKKSKAAGTPAGNKGKKPAPMPFALKQAIKVRLFFGRPVGQSVNKRGSETFRARHHHPIW